MPHSWQISCIKRTGRDDPHLCIRSVGGPEGSGWQLTLQGVLNHLRDGNHFWVSVGGERVDVIVAIHEGQPYIKTTADGVQPDTLLALPDCRVPSS
jgi:hypothetical protein